MSEEFHKESLAAVIYNGPFDWDKIHDYIIAQFDGFDHHEEVHKYKKAGEGHEKEIEWMFERKITDFVKYECKVAFRMWDYQPVEVVVDGKKKKMHKARFEMTGNYAVILDWQDRFKHPFAAKLLRWYKNIRFEPILVEYALPMRRKMTNLFEDVKDMLGGSSAHRRY